MEGKSIVDGLRMELPNGLSCIVSLESTGYNNSDHDALMELLSSSVRQMASEVALTPSQAISVSISIIPGNQSLRLPIF